MPIPVLLAGSAGALLAQVLRYVFMAHLAGFVIRLFSVLGLSLATNYVVVDPVLDLIHANLSGMNGTIVRWLDFLEFDKVISILASAYTLRSLRHVFLGKADV